MPDIPPVHNTYLAFFHFEQTDTVAEKLQIFFGSLASDFGSAQLLVESRIVVIFVRRQVHLVVVHLLRGAVVAHVLAHLLLLLHELLGVFTVSDFFVVHISQPILLKVRGPAQLFSQLIIVFKIS